MALSLAARLLNVSLPKTWEIKDTVGDLVLIHSNAKTDQNSPNYLRGLIIDVKAERIVAPPVQVPPKVVSDDIILTDTEIIVGETKLPREGTIATRGFEGFGFRIFKHNNYVFCASSKRIDAVDMRWGDSPTFGEMFEEALEMNPLDFFDSEANSPYVHTFLVYHPRHLNASRFDAKLSPKGFVIPITCVVMYPPTKPQTPIQLKNQVPVVPLLELDKAQDFLRNGWSGTYNEDHPELGDGEFILFWSGGKNVLRVDSQAYTWRTSIHACSGSISDRFSQILTESISTRFKSKNYFPFASRTREELQAMLPLRSLEVSGFISMDTKPPGVLLYDSEDKILVLESVRAAQKSRFSSLIQNYLLSLPPHRQQELLDIWKETDEKRVQLTNYVMDNLTNRMVANDVERIARLSRGVRSNVEELLATEVGHSLASMFGSLSL